MHSDRSWVPADQQDLLVDIPSEYRAVNELSIVLGAKLCTITSYGAVSRLPGRSGANTPVTSITYEITNCTSAWAK